MRYLHVGMVFQFLPLVAAGLLSSRLGTVTTLAALWGAGLVSIATGAWILRGSPVGAITWRNRVASWLMPWGHVLGGPTLLAVAGSSFLAWILLVLVGAIGWSEPWLLAAWVLDGIALRLLAARVWQQRGDRVQRRVVGRLLVLVLALAAGGLVCQLLGQPLLGAWLAGGPVAVVGILLLLWVGLLVVVRPSRYS